MVIPLIKQKKRILNVRYKQKFNQLTGVMYPNTALSILLASVLA